MLIYLFSKKNEYFQTSNITPTNNIISPLGSSIELDINEPNYYTKIISSNESPNLDIDKIFSNDSNDLININVGNSIIAENHLKINGKKIDIKAIRHIKKIPIHYQKEICLTDKDGSKECINKEHIDILKGQRPIQLISYPDNYRKCLQAFEKRFMYDISGKNIDNAQIFTAQDCKDGLKPQHFKIERTYDHIDEHSHYHIHSINREMHNNNYNFV